MELISFLSKYSVDCIASSIFSCFSVCFMRKYIKMNVKTARLMPFLMAFVIYAIVACFGLLTFDKVIQKSMTAGGLATVIYAFLGGYSLTSEEELKDLMSVVLKSVVASEKIEKVTNDILSGLYESKDEYLVTIKISDLIKANIKDNFSDEQVNMIATIFVTAYKRLCKKRKFVE